MDALQLKKVVIIGPESTGKSTLCRQLAEEFNTLWCPEYARAYLEANGKEYRFEDLLRIAAGQLIMEDTVAGEVLRRKDEQSGDRRLGAVEQEPLLFIDTDMYVMKVWSEYVFGQSHDFIERHINERRYDLYLLCNIDLPWVYDEFREHPEDHRRSELYGIYRQLMMNQPTPWVEVSGDYTERFQTAVAAVRSLVADTGKLE